MTDDSSSLFAPEADGAAPSRTYRASRRPLALRLLLRRETAVIALLVIVYAYAAANVQFFSGELTIYFLLLDLAPILLIALPMTMVIITGEIDLSVASIVALASVMMGVATEHGVPIVLAAIIALVVGAAAGLLNGVLVSVVGLPSLAVTIGTQALYRGIAVGLLGTRAVTDWPQSWTSWVKGSIGGSQIPQIVIPIAILAALFLVLLHYTSFGRGVFAIGLSEDAARFSGVKVHRTKIIVFVLSGLMSALGGVYFTVQYSSARGDNATGMELQVIAAVLLGGVSIFGGKGALPGVLGGVLLIGVIGSALRLDNHSANIIQIITGVLLVASVVASSLLGWLNTRWRAFRGGSRGTSSSTSGRRVAGTTVSGPAAELLSGGRPGSGGSSSTTGSTSGTSTTPTERVAPTGSSK